MSSVIKFVDTELFMRFGERRTRASLRERTDAGAPRGPRHCPEGALTSACSRAPGPPGGCGRGGDAGGGPWRGGPPQARRRGLPARRARHSAAPGPRAAVVGWPGAAPSCAPGPDARCSLSKRKRLWLAASPLAALSLCAAQTRAPSPAPRSSSFAVDEVACRSGRARALPRWRGGEASALFSSGRREMEEGARTTAPVTATPTASTPSPSAAQPKAERSRGTWKSVRPHWPQPTAVESPTTRK
ncbi:transcription initiation factor TFIID subunit 4-like [Equus quagga]|uniref:transcription initiation factor TFIID subunit 4-like n=1 Tax=Equus quagga TaxID=89248 RepID=UPI001EE30A50|nr:transcription initiation factor TFIID subunit 4-like [Equus quagga]